MLPEYHSIIAWCGLNEPLALTPMIVPSRINAVVKIAEIVALGVLGVVASTCVALTAIEFDAIRKIIPSFQFEFARSVLKQHYWFVAAAIMG